MTSPATALSASHAFGATDTPLIEATIGDFFADMARRQGEREALVSRHQGLRYAYAGLHRRRAPIGQRLAAIGPGKGDRVGIWSHNNAEWVLMQLATAQVGLILVNINPAYRTAEVEYALEQGRLQGAGDHGAIQDQRLPGHAARAGPGAGPLHARHAGGQAPAQPAHGGVD